MASNVEQFNRDLLAESESMVQEELVLFHKFVTLNLLRRVVLKTPVDTGRARGNWQVSIGVPSSGTNGSVDKSGQGTIAQGQQAVSTLLPFTQVFISNNVEYIEVLEYGKFVPPNPGPSKDTRKGRTGEVLVEGGFSTQAPKGMLRVSIEELRTELGN